MTTATAVFQSTPAIAGERCHDAAQRAGVLEYVLIHARHRWRAVRRRPGSWCRATRFNPRPPSLASGARPRGGLPRWRRGFNPRPPSLASGARRRPGPPRRRPVSIHARHRWRAVPASAAAAAAATVFQSTPAIAGERCRGRIPHRRSAPCFNPRPPSLASGAPWPGRRSGPRARFNPRPPSLASGAPPSAPSSSPTGCFNPRPPSLASGATALDAHAALAQVSIHARHRWRAVRRPGLVPGDTVQFQSTPAIAGERCPPRRRS